MSEEESLNRIEIRFHESNGELNQNKCLDTLDIDQIKIDKVEQVKISETKSITLSIPAFSANSLEKEFFPKYRDFFRKMFEN